jgi:hypothetical protein
MEESSLGRLTIPDVLMPVQYYEGARTSHPETQAMKRLMLAVLEDALRCLQTYTESRNPIHRRMFAEAEFWILDRKAQGPFAFESICETFGIEPDHLRHGIRQWCRQLCDGQNSRRLKRRSIRRSEPRSSMVSRRLTHQRQKEDLRDLVEMPGSLCVIQATDSNVESEVVAAQCCP